MGNDVADLLIGHEVGHALFTPAEGWHDAATNVEGIPRAFLNIIEDIRIERAIQNQYPGLVRSFKLGYKVLFEENFFGTKDRELTSYGLPDRINIKAKLNDLVEIDFADEERSVVEQCFSVKTWEDVVDAARALYEFTKQAREDMEQEKNVPMPINIGDEENDSDGQRQGKESSSEENPLSKPMDSVSDDEGEFEETADESESESSSSTGEVEENAEEEGEGSQTESGGDEWAPVETDNAFRSNEGKLIEVNSNNTIPVVAKEMTASDVEKLVIGYKEVFEKRDARRVEYFAMWDDRYDMFTDEENVSKYKNFLVETKRVVTTMAKEFELKKAAYRYSRAKTSRTGSLDMKKLHSYKYNDDIFARNLVMADAKNHGMIMYIDYSGSMNDTLATVQRQVINLAFFCRKVNIPFEVYGFTSNYSRGYRNGNPIVDLKTNIDVDDLSLFELINNRMSSTEFDRAVRDLFFQSMTKPSYRTWEQVSSPFEDLGGTPLDTTILAAFKVAERFQNKYKVDKLNTVFLTDGASHNIDLNGAIVPYYDDYFYVTVGGSRKKVIIRDTTEDGRFSRKKPATPQLLKMYKERFGGSLIGYYVIGTNRDINYFFMSAKGKDHYEAVKEFRRNKFYLLDDFLGYDRMFVIKGGKALDTENEEFEVLAGAKKGEITRQFKKFAGSKKGNRVLVTKFAEMVA
jgi:hypothetical protein